MTNGWEHLVSWFSTGRRYKTNILTPIAWGGLLVVPPSFYGLLSSDEIILKLFFGLIIFTFGWFYISQYLYWREKDPDRLQSEWFASEKMRATMQIKGESPKSIEGKEIVNPPKQLPEGDNR